MQFFNHALEISSKTVEPASAWKHKLTCLAAITTLMSGHYAIASAPSVVVDAQQTIGSDFFNPQGVAIAPNGTVYVADTDNNQVIALTTNLPGASTQIKVSTSATRL
jgi:hypothetical protein